MKVQQDTMLACFNQVVENLSRKVDSILYDVQDLKTGLNCVQCRRAQCYEATLSKINRFGR